MENSPELTLKNYENPPFQTLTLINFLRAHTLSIDELGLRKRLNEEFKRYQKFQSMIGMEKSKDNHIDADMKNYAKYILREGNILEKRELLTYLKDRILLTNKIVTLAK